MHEHTLRRHHLTYIMYISGSKSNVYAHLLITT